MKIRNLIVSVMIGILLAGCAVNPTPLKQDEMLTRATKDITNLYKGQEPLSGPLSLEEIMSRSLKYNLDHRLKLMEDALALRQLDLAKYDMLPKLVAAAGYNTRNQYNAAASMNVFTDQQSLAPSTSQDKAHSTADMTLTWNILDFGVSYFQARQQADRAMIMTERRRKVVHTIMQQVRHAYWLALGAQQLEGRFEPLLKEVEKALSDSRRIEKEKLRAPMETLTYQKTLLEILRQLEAFRDELSQAKTRLASLINLPPGQQFRLVVPAAMDMPKIPEGIEQMEYRALLMRPEIREADYNTRISAGEVKKAIARMFPGIELTAGGHYDTNSYLVWNSWFEGGLRVTWNLINLLSGPTQYKVATAQTEIADAQRLALSMAILTQIHLSYHDFFSRQRQYDLSRQLQEIDANIHQQTKNAMVSGAQSRLIEIRAATTSLMAEFRSYQNYAALQNAYGQIIASLGVDPLPETVEGHDVKTLANAIRESMSRSWDPIPIDKKLLKEEPRQNDQKSVLTPLQASPQATAPSPQPPAATPPTTLAVPAAEGKITGSSAETTIATAAAPPAEKTATSSEAAPVQPIKEPPTSGVLAADVKTQTPGSSEPAALTAVVPPPAEKPAAKPEPAAIAASAPAPVSVPVPVPAQQAASDPVPTDNNKDSLKVASPQATTPSLQPPEAAPQTTISEPTADAKTPVSVTETTAATAAAPPAEKNATSSETASVQPIKEEPPAEKPAAKPELADTAIAPAEFGCYSIQVAISYKREDALKFRDAIQKKGFAAAVVKLPSDVYTYRIMVDRFQTRQDALKFIKSENIKRKFPGSIVQMFCPSVFANRQN